MKKIGEYTTRGAIRTDNSVNRIILDDGSFKTGYRITEFRICTADIDSTSIRGFSCKLLTDEGAALSPSAGINFNFDNNEEIAWALFSWDANGPQSQIEWSLVDPDNLVIQDLFLIADETVSSVDIKMNYFIRMEKYEISDWRGALGMVRNRSQA